MSTLHLSYEGLRLAVSADSDADLIWLHDFLGPTFRCVAGDPVREGVRIGLHAEPGWAELLRSWEQEPAGAGHRVLAHVLDTVDRLLPCRFGADGSLLAREDDFDCFYRRDSAGVISLLQSPGPPRSRRPRIAMMRAVRECALHHDWRTGGLCLHASGLVRGGRAVLFAGPRRAGKTMLLSACLSLVPGLQLLANDRVMLNPHGEGWRSRGMATVVSVRAGDEELLPGLRQRLHAHTLGPEVGPGEGRARVFPFHGQLLLSPSQYCHSLGVTMTPESRLLTILLPRIDATGSGLRCRRIDPARATMTLAASLFGASHPDSRSQIFDTPASGPHAGPAERQALVERLGREVPCWELVMGPDAYRPKHLRGLLADLFDSA